MPKLQIGIELDLDRDPEPEIRVTPVDIDDAPEDVLEAARTLAAFLDRYDAEPGDGEGDLPIRTRLPVVRIFGRALTAELRGNLFLRVV